MFLPKEHDVANSDWSESSQMSHLKDLPLTSESLKNSLSQKIPFAEEVSQALNFTVNRDPWMKKLIIKIFLP